MGKSEFDMYAQLGIRPIINCQGQRTMLGGSRLSQDVVQAMAQANGSWALMREVMERASAYVAHHMGTEAAYITSGCAAAMTLSAAACISRNDPDKRGQLPDSTGMRNEILMPKKQKYGYERAFTSSGAKLVYVGEENGCSKEQLDQAIGPNTVAIGYLVDSPPDKSLMSLKEAVEVGRARGIPVIADAAAQIYPIDYFLETAQTADLVCFGGKFFGAPNSTGFVCGNKELVDAVAEQGFIAFQTQEDGQRAIGRPMKLDRQSIIALISALRTWVTMNHEDRLLGIDGKLSAIQRGLSGIPHVRTQIVSTDHYSGSSLQVVLDTEALGKTPESVARELDAGDTRIWIVSGEGDFFGAEYLHDRSLPSDTFVINAQALDDGEVQIVADTVRNVLIG
jgi:D-glucosaminate-6-phosphate ammonia-lyase